MHILARLKTKCINWNKPQSYESFEVTNESNVNATMTGFTFNVSILAFSAASNEDIINKCNILVIYKVYRILMRTYKLLSNACSNNINLLYHKCLKK